ncbi:unnamed protein product [Brassica napus]|uniref:(rape) hypothetical protein n=1 Tax=Brassica napus TaxID=3708 RepID=A0A816KXM6_BRANA|nr:unnamed protein product [Brassica napus]
MRQYIHRLRQEGELGCDNPRVNLKLSLGKRALSSKQLSKAHETNQFTRIRRLISKSLEEEEKPNIYETEDDKNKVVLYFTSLSGIRKTYEDCCCVRGGVERVSGCGVDKRSPRWWHGGDQEAQ